MHASLTESLRPSQALWGPVMLFFRLTTAWSVACWGQTIAASALVWHNWQVFGSCNERAVGHPVPDVMRTSLSIEWLGFSKQAEKPANHSPPWQLHFRFSERILFVIVMCMHVCTCVGMCVNVHMYMCVCACECACVWRSEVAVKCLL